MLIFRGRMPKPKNSVRYRRSLRTQAWVLLVLVTALPGAHTAVGQSVRPLTLEEAEALALSDEPGRSSYLFRAEGLREESVAGGQLPDPTLRVGIGNFPIQSGGFTTEGMTQAQLAVRQVFPGGDTRELTTQKFQELAEEMSHKADGRGRDVLAAVRIAWLESHFWRPRVMP